MDDGRLYLAMRWEYFEILNIFVAKTTLNIHLKNDEEI